MRATSQSVAGQSGLKYCHTVQATISIPIIEDIEVFARAVFNSAILAKIPWSLDDVGTMEAGEEVDLEMC